MSVLRVCKDFHALAERTLYSGNTFRFNHVRYDLSNFLLRLSKAACTYLRSVQIRCHILYELRTSLSDLAPFRNLRSLTVHEFFTFDPNLPPVQTLRLKNFNLRDVRELSDAQLMSYFVTQSFYNLKIGAVFDARSDDERLELCHIDNEEAPAITALDASSSP